MDLHLKDKTVIVTGSSKGIGKAVATQFAKEGAKVFISSRKQETLDNVAKEIIQETNNHNIFPIACDLAHKQEIDTLINKVSEQTGRIDVLINNTGGPKAGNFIDMSDEDWIGAFNDGVLSFIRLIRNVLPYMKNQKSGHIVNITSSSMKQTIDNLILSNTMRPGIVGLAKSLSQELAADNILINSVGPGIIQTDRIIELNKVRADKTGIPVEQLLGQAEKSVPLQRLGKPEEFAKAVVFLASGANSYITGQTLIVDGGLLKAY